MSDAKGCSTAIITGVFTLIGVLITSLTTLLVAGKFDPSFVRLDFIFPKEEIHIIDDFIYVKVTNFSDRRTDKPFEHDAESGEDIYDKATYVEHIRLRRSKNTSYAIHAQSSGLHPRVLQISPPVGEPVTSLRGGLRMIDATLELSQDAQFATTGTVEDIKLMYEYRNGFQPPDNSDGGKIIKYPTDQLTIVVDFSLVADRIREKPIGVVMVGKTEVRRLNVNWSNSLATVVAYNQEPGRQLLLKWKWQ